MKMLRVIYQARDGQTGLTDVKTSLFKNGALLAASLPLTEVDAVNAPGIYALEINRTQLETTYGLDNGGDQIYTGLIDSVTAPAPAPWTKEVLFADFEDVINVVTNVRGKVELVQAAVNALDSYIRNDLATIVAVTDTKVNGIASDTQATRSLLEGGQGVASIAAALQALQSKVDAQSNNTTFESKLLPQIPKPASGSKTIRVPITIQNEHGSVENPDGDIEVTLVDVEGTDYSSRLVGGAATPGTPGSSGGGGGGTGGGSFLIDRQYRFDGTLASDTNEPAKTLQSYSQAGDTPQFYDGGLYMGSGTLLFTAGQPFDYGTGAFAIRFDFENPANSPAGFDRLIMASGDDNENFGWTIKADDQRVSFTQLNPLFQLEGSFNLYTGGRHSVTVKRNAQGLMIMIIDGTIVAQDTNPTAPQDLEDQNFYIGGNYNFPNIQRGNFLIDEVVLAKSELPPNFQLVNPIVGQTGGGGGGGAATPGTPGSVKAVKAADGEFYIDMVVSEADEAEQLIMSFNYSEGGAQFRKKAVTRLVADAIAEGTALQSTLLTVAQGVADNGAILQSVNGNLGVLRNDVGESRAILTSPVYGPAAIRQAIADLAAQSVDLSPVVAKIDAVQTSLDDATNGLTAIRTAADLAASKAEASRALLTNADYGLEPLYIKADQASTRANQAYVGTNEIQSTLAGFIRFGGRAL